MTRARNKASASGEAEPQFKPFVKWVGGKGRLLKQLEPLLPKTIDDYGEHFVGGGALFYFLRNTGRIRGDVVLSDVNEELVNVYRVVRNHVADLIFELKRHRYEEAYFYEVRKIRPESLDPVARAARTIFLNKTCINGLYRVNKKGLFNASFGTYTNPKICDEKTLRACSLALRDVVLCAGDYSLAQHAARGSFRYFDPPYVPLTKTADFTSYTSGKFTWPNHVQLLELCKDLDRRGVLWMISNSDTPETRKLYSGFNVTTVQAGRAVNSDATKRGKVSELVVRNYG